MTIMIKTDPEALDENVDLYLTNSFEEFEKMLNSFHLTQINYENGTLSAERPHLGILYRKDGIFPISDIIV